ncbi:uncharacterized protein LOC134991232 [Pseudophryne corroboree]|uniref:uncharacterized protein LOC134991232 n=1 Tax=Pseudophryne corroboree TaxID=495146 RepID=UPI0030819A35
MTDNFPSTADEPSVMPHILTLDNPSMVDEPSMLHHDATVDHATMLDQPSMLQHTSTVDDTSFVAEPSMLKHSARVDDHSTVDQTSMMQEYSSVVHSSTTVETSTVNETSMRQEQSTMDDPFTEDGNSTMLNPLMLDKAIESNMVTATQTQDNINEEPVLHSQKSNIDTEDTNQVELNAETAHSSVIAHGLQDQFLDSTNQECEVSRSQTISQQDSLKEAMQLIERNRNEEMKRIEHQINQLNNNIQILNTTQRQQNQALVTLANFYDHLVSSQNVAAINYQQMQHSINQMLAWQYETITITRMISTFI